MAPEALSGPYLAAQAVPVFALAMLAIVAVAVVYFSDRRRFAEAFESFLDADPGLARLRRGLWEIARGASLSGGPPSDAELGRRYVALLAENLGEPGFRELVLRAADLDRGAALAFFLLRDREGVSARAGEGPLADAVDLRVPGHDTLFFDALATGLLCPMAMPLRRVSFPKGAVHAGETHRLTDATFVPGSGIEEALAAGAEQVIVVTGVPETAAPLARRRGPLARIDASVRALERQAAAEIGEAWRVNRMVSTLGHRGENGRGAWEDPATGPPLRRGGPLGDPPGPPRPRADGARRGARPRDRGPADDGRPAASWASATPTGSSSSRSWDRRRFPSARKGSTATRSRSGSRPGRSGGFGLSERGPGTKAVHGRHEARPGPLATPIVQTSTFAFGSAAEMRRHLEGDEELFLYTRYANPTVRELEESLAAVEDAEAALALVFRAWRR